MCCQAGSNSAGAVTSPAHSGERRMFLARPPPTVGQVERTIAERAIAKDPAAALDAARSTLERARAAFAAMGPHHQWDPKRAVSRHDGLATAAARVALLERLAAGDDA